MEFECPVCYEQYQPPIYQCPAGHSLCNECIQRLQLCPVCRRRLPTTGLRNLELESKISATVPCRFAFRGCRVRLQACKQDEHVKDCPNRPIRCAFASHGCAAWVTPGEMEDHKRACPYWIAIGRVNRVLTEESKRSACIFAPIGCTVVLDSSRMEQHVDNCRFGREPTAAQDDLAPRRPSQPSSPRLASPNLFRQFIVQLCSVLLSVLRCIVFLIGILIIFLLFVALVIVALKFPTLLFLFILLRLTHDAER